MRRLILLAAVAALFLVALPIASAAASPPEDVVFVADALFDGTGTFIAFGPDGPSDSVEAVCPEGTTKDLINIEAPKRGQSPKGVNLTVLKEFTCNDGTGTFQAKLQVRIDYFRGVNFNWVIVGGTDDYEDLKGAGGGMVVAPIGDPPNEIGVVDVYTGKLH